MDDQILPEEPAQAQPLPPAPAPADARLDRLEQAMGQLADTVRDAANRLTQAPTAPPVQKPDEFLNDLAANPQEVIRREAAFAARQVGQEQNPVLMNVLSASNQHLMNLHRQKVDGELGEGTFDELFLPQLNKDVAQLKSINPQAIADPATLEALVNRLYGGDNFPVLMERRRNLEETARVRGVSHLLPSGGVPRLRAGNPQEEIHPDAELFLREVEKATGENVDRKTYTKLYHTGKATPAGGHRTDLADYLRAVGADADTKRKHGIT